MQWTVLYILCVWTKIWGHPSAITLSHKVFISTTMLSYQVFSLLIKTFVLCIHLPFAPKFLATTDLLIASTALPFAEYRIVGIYFTSFPWKGRFKAFNLSGPIHAWTGQALGGNQSLELSKRYWALSHKSRQQPHEVQGDACWVFVYREATSFVPLSQ